MDRLERRVEILDAVENEYPTGLRRLENGYFTNRVLWNYYANIHLEPKTY